MPAVTNELTDRSGLRLDIGSGVRKREGFIGVDVSPGASVDVRGDLEKGLPFKDDTFSEVWMNHVFEHLTDPVAAMEEVWRVCKHGATVEIRGPHFSMPSLVWGDPTHKRGLSLTTFQYFNGSCHYANARFRIESCKLQKGNTSFQECGWKMWYWPFVVPNFLIEKLINSSTSWVSRYERSVSRFIGFQEIRVVMSPQKQHSE
jgi:SAM-dependent methyltransferase